MIVHVNYEVTNRPIKPFDESKTDFDDVLASRRQLETTNQCRHHLGVVRDALGRGEHERVLVVSEERFSFPCL